MSAARPFTVAILGGAGVFGKRAGLLLAESPDNSGCQDPLKVVLVGRRQEQEVRGVLEDLRASVRCDVQYASVNARDSQALQSFLRSYNVDAVIDAAGPFQGQETASQSNASEAFATPRACIRGGVRMYTDLADAGSYVAELPAALEEEARQAGACVVTGASTVPGLTGTVVAELSERMTEVRSISSVVLPGNDAPRGEAVMRSVVGAAGKPLPRFRDGAWTQVPGWSEMSLTAVRGVTPRLGAEQAAAAGLDGSEHIEAPPRGLGLGPAGDDFDACLWRLASSCDAPDTVLWPAERAGARACRAVPPRAEAAVRAASPSPCADLGLRSSDFAAGLELWWMHAGLALLSLPVRWGLVPGGIEPLVPPLRAVAEAVRTWGTNRGGMVVRLEGWEAAPATGGGRGGGGLASVPVRAEWHLVAGSGHGPFVPVTTAVALVQAERRRRAQHGDGTAGQGTEGRASGVGRRSGDAGSPSRRSGHEDWADAALRPGARHAGGLVPLGEVRRVWREGGLALADATFRMPTGTAKDSPAVGREATDVIFVPLTVADAGTGSARSPLERWNDIVLTRARSRERPRPRDGAPGSGSVAEHSSPPVWRSALGEGAWCDVGDVVRRVHGWPSDARVTSKVMTGSARVLGGAGAAGWLLRRVLGLPEGTGGAWCPLEVRMSRDPVSGEETWQRLFGRDEAGEAGRTGHAATCLSVGDGAGDAGRVWERPMLSLGGAFFPAPASIGMRTGTAPNPEPGATAHGAGRPRGERRCLVMEGVTMTVLGVPLPPFLAPRVVGREWEGPIPETAGDGFAQRRKAGERVFRFDVSIALPLLGEAAGYSGFLLAPENGRPDDEDPWGCDARKRRSELGRRELEPAADGLAAAGRECAATPDGKP